MRFKQVKIDQRAGHRSQVIVDGQLVQHVYSYHVDAQAQHVPVLTLEVLVTRDMLVELADGTLDLRVAGFPDCDEAFLRQVIQAAQERLAILAQRDASPGRALLAPSTRAENVAPSPSPRAESAEAR